MERINKIIISILVVSLAGCATTAQNGKSQGVSTDVKAKTIAPIKVPSGMSTASMQNYYPIPNVPAATNGTMAPSAVPPNSALMQQQQQQSRASSPTPAAQVAPQGPVVTASTSSTLVLNLGYDQAWGQVGKALSSSGYKVMQQDKSMGAYYVLDTASTGGKLQTDTPIYHVNLKQSGRNTTVTLLDAKGGPANPSVSGRILGAVKGKL